ncbi:sulfurtransferase [Pseudomonas lalucatii]|uniref:Sulfurtransferase n=1 Tax=Pseudomonas lalucatii TaxID=1424203 RepID=A0ABS5PZK4_9PSED|nr:rhodanese-like domain-containing protein [Pseudomonas lalucatii]MBS7661319.1 sulfurtransferase [Pseudomonas lalucatii]MBS7724163.1 sulfurtransferase [Pseudomonas lalucatii]QVM87837.1 sulfurtransferase [Pseudomonas lalucatii]
MAEAVAVAELQALLASARPPLLCDVRRQPAFDASPQVIPGALRRQPEAVADWAAALPGAAEVVVYCVHGHEVSQGVAAYLGGLGLRARYLRGGIEQWKTEGGATAALRD